MTDANQTNAGDARDGAGASDKPAEKFKNQIATLKSQASDKARDYADKGLGHASDALDEAARFLSDTAKTVDEKLGPQYGRYGLSAAESVSGLAEQLRNKNLDELIDDARALVRKSPGVAIGAAVGLGFVLARLAKAGIGFDDGDKDTKPTKAPKPDTPTDAA